MTQPTDLSLGAPAIPTPITTSTAASAGPAANEASPISSSAASDSVPSSPSLNAVQEQNAFRQRCASEHKPMSPLMRPRMSFSYVGEDDNDEKMGDEERRKARFRLMQLRLKD